MLYSVKLYITLGLTCLIGGMLGLALYAVDKHGYNRAVAYYQPILDKQTAMVKELSDTQQKTKEIVVTKYLTKYLTITQTIDRIVSDTPEALKNENNNCTIGPNFIRLHNDASNDRSVPNSTAGIDATRKTIKPSTGTN